MACVGNGNISSWQYGLPMKQEPMDSDSGITSSPGSDIHDNRYPEDSQDHLRRLEISLIEKGMYSMDNNSNKSENEESDEPVKAPRVNSHGKVKTYKCKQCAFVALTKLEYWDHTKNHIKEEKRLQCPRCPFITEYKHHLEYHLRNHSGSKPFKCSQCEYSCVNKSMLNSHMKSHSNLYRYNCLDCSYATKYCHSLKTHLKKYKHKPDVVLDEAGSPCPEIIIDVYGTRRGPKVKAKKSRNASEMAQILPKNEMIPFGLNLMAAAAAANPQFPCYPFFANTQMIQNFQQMVLERQNCITPPEESPKYAEDSSALDLSKPSTSQKSRRKGPAFKLDRLESNDSEDEESGTETTVFANVETVENVEGEKEERANNNNKGEENTTCQYCAINFGDPVLYTMHMGYHGFNNPFTCNMCGVECGDKVTFFLHIARTSHL